MSEKSKKVGTCWECRWWADDPITGHSDEAQFDPSRGHCSFPLDFILAPGECCPVFDDGEFDKAVADLTAQAKYIADEKGLKILGECVAAVEAAMKEREERGR